MGYSFVQQGIRIGRVAIHSRSMRAKPFIRKHAIKIGDTKLYNIGPIAIFVRKKTNA